MNLCDYLNAERGRASTLATDLKVPPELVSQWRNNVRPVPVVRCPAIAQATKGLVRCEDLRPDVDWAFLRGTAAPQTDTPTTQEV